VLDAPASNAGGDLWRDTFISSTYLLGQFEQNETFPTMKSMIHRKYSPRILTQFSQGNNVLDAAGSNADSFLGRDMCVPSTDLKVSLWRKETLSSPVNT
jgi:hypothetical protein